MWYGNYYQESFPSMTCTEFTKFGELWQNCYQEYYMSGNRHITRCNSSLTTSGLALAHTEVVKEFYILNLLLFHLLHLLPDVEYPW